ncbi:MAG: CbtB-domain containing protein [Rhodopila sp.]
MDAATTSTTLTTAGRTGRASLAAQAVLAMILGAFVVGIAGFSHIEAIHNAAHDTRHVNGFPCH